MAKRSAVQSRNRISWRWMLQMAPSKPRSLVADVGRRAEKWLEMLQKSGVFNNCSIQNVVGLLGGRRHGLWNRFAALDRTFSVTLVLIVLIIGSLLTTTWCKMQAFAVVCGACFLTWAGYCFIGWKRAHRQFRNMLQHCELCKDYSSTLVRVLKGDLVLLGFECEKVELCHANPWSGCDCRTKSWNQMPLWPFRRKAPEDGIVRHKTALAVWSKLSIDTTHVVDDPASDNIWVYLPETLVHSMQDRDITDLFVQAQSKIWMFLCGQNFEQHIMKMLSGSAGDSWVRHSACSTDLCIDGADGLRKYHILIKFALHYNGWPSAAKPWIQKASETLPEALVQRIVQAGCWLLHEECRSENCPDHSLDWKYNFTEVDSLLFDHYSKQTALCLAYLKLVAIGTQNTDGLQWSPFLLECLRMTFFNLAKYGAEGVLNFTDVEEVEKAVSRLLRELETSIRLEKLTHHILNSVNLLGGLSAHDRKWLLVMVEKAKGGR